MKKHLSTILLVVVLLAGLSILLYPTVSDYWNSKKQSRTIVDYDALLSHLSEEDSTALFAPAEAYNEKLRQISSPLTNYDQIAGVEEYDDILNVDGTGVIGYISIEKIDVKLPIAHGTSEEVLKTAAGHLQGSSFPIGGESTHAVISAHRGLPSAKLFTHLDKLEVGDTFVITVLDRELTYEVDQILVVEPQNTDALGVIDGEDLCTLMTCTPYGINTHRLLVRGRRAETKTEINIEKKD